MISLSVDTTSQSFALGQVSGVLFIAAVAITLLWKLSTSWRAPSTPYGGDPAETARLEGKRRKLTIAVTLLIAAAAVVQAVIAYNPEPRASETAPPGGAEAALHQPSSITAPDSFGDYRLMTGEAAERAETAVLAGRSKPQGLRAWYYDKHGDEDVHAVFMARSTEWDPTLKDEKNTQSISQEFQGFFAGAKARDVAKFDPGQAGGGLSCGYVTGPDGDQSVCVWSDATTFGVLRIVDPTALADAAQITTALRTSAMR
ncbi:hypothetical protein OG625_15180 [Streptomyces sp. NBC_01351]|uniref:hypothetical protein n=1 Tax=Streptomyces sp. NBC_01351 TaxID=2903833 RepID=UPI002E3665F7|nr:hypothetical protein [Streptomyces sp. NBC_01351]